MARSSADDLQRLLEATVSALSARLDDLRGDVAAQQDALVHEVRSLHEATIRAMAELRAAVHRIELALHDQLAALEPTPAAGIARPHLATAEPPRPAPETPRTAVTPHTNAPATPVAPPVVEVAPPATPVALPVVEVAPTDRAESTATPADAASAATPGLDVDRLVAMLESRLGEIDMTSGTSTD